MAFRRPKALRAGTEPRRRWPANLTGATAQVELSASSWRTWKFGNKDWQAEVWRLYDIVIELHKLAGRIGDSVSQCRLYVTEVDDTGEETGETTDQRIRQLAAVPLGTGAQRDDNLRLAGIDLAVPGECWIVGEGAATNPEKAEGSWFVVTGAAIKNQAGMVKVKRPMTRGGAWLELQDGTDILIRCWRPHPNDADQADSFSRAGIVPLREIELLTKREFAELDSRLTGAGMLPLPEGIDFPRGPDDPEGLAGFVAYMQRTAAASMANQSNASAMVPAMFTVPDQVYEAIKDVKPITFWSELSAAIPDMKDRAIARLASGAEIPAEVLTGIGDANHWTAWLISEEGTRWIKGYLALIADALTRGFLHRALTSIGVANPERFAFAFDTAPLAARPNRLEEALQLHERQLLSDDEVVKAGAFDLTQMPSTAERVNQLLWVMVKAQPDLALDPAVQAALGLPAIKSVGLPPTADQNTDGQREDEEDEGTDNAPPNGGNAPNRPDDADEARAITAGLNARIIAAKAAPPTRERVFNASAKLAVLRALELAGGRLTTPAERRGRWAEVPRHELNRSVGPITPDKADRVLAGSWNHVPMLAADLGVDAAELERFLHGYCLELLTRGMAHHDDLLYAALGVANRGRGLVGSTA